MAVREDTAGRLVEKAATRFDLRNPLVDPPQDGDGRDDYGTRAAMPALVEVENVAFEGFLVRREVVDAIGMPDPSYFIFYDDVDYAAPGPAGRLPDLGGARRRAGPPARLRPAARPERRGRGTTCTATCSWCTSGTARTALVRPSPG